MKNFIKSFILLIATFISNTCYAQFDLSIVNNTGCSVTFTIYDNAGTQLGAPVTSASIGTTNITCINGTPFSITASRLNCISFNMSINQAATSFSGTVSCGCGLSALIDSAFTGGGGSCPPLSDLLVITIN